MSCYKDTPGKLDVVSPVAEDDDENMGLKAPYAFIKQIHTVDMMGPIHSDIFFHDHSMLNGVSLRMKLNRARNYFCWVSPATVPEFKDAAFFCYCAYVLAARDIRIS